jgi:hypothetical protein
LLIAAGVLLPAVTIAASQSAVTRLVAAAVSIAIFVAARLLSQMHLPELALAGVFPAILILASQMWPPVRRSAA